MLEEICRIDYGEINWEMLEGISKGTQEVILDGITGQIFDRKFWNGTSIVRQMWELLATFIAPTLQREKKLLEKKYLKVQEELPEKILQLELDWP